MTGSHPSSRGRAFARSVALRRVLIVPLASASPVVARHSASLVDVLRRAGADPHVLPARVRMPPPSRALAWLAAFAPAQLEPAWRVAREARRDDVVMLFLGAHHLPAAIVARLRGARVVFLPGGHPSRQARPWARPLVRALERSVAALSHVVAVESQ